MSTLEREPLTNSIDMALVPIEPGSFCMGSVAGERDERPVHVVRLTRAFHLAATPVTNRQYEMYDPDHKGQRGLHGLSSDDDEAVVQVSWEDSVGFCDWLSQRESRPYRLPTEAEWEYSCRAGTDTAYHTGAELPEMHHRHQEDGWAPTPVSLHVGRTPPNAFGLRDMHGLVEEWCADWYGPYPTGEQLDPVGYVDGDFKVTRGGSHNSDLTYLRSANRSGTLPDDRHWLIGFRVALGEAPAAEPMPRATVPMWARSVSCERHDWGHPSDKPVFHGPEPFIVAARDPESVPIYEHNHCPTITWCDNGDLLAAWFSCRQERGRAMTILAARRRAGSDRWDEPSEFFNAPDRNMTGSALFNDGAGTLYHFNGLGTAGCFGNPALVMRTSTDSGATWDRPRLIGPEHKRGNQVISGTSLTAEGAMIQLCDGIAGEIGGTFVHASEDGGQTWENRSAGTANPEIAAGKTGGCIAGIHAGVVELGDGRLLALGRGNDIDGQMPMSVSKDAGRTWTYSASGFPPIASGQRLVLMRLADGPILFVSFTDTSARLRQKGDRSADRSRSRGMLVQNGSGGELRVHGMFAAISEDAGRTWGSVKPVSPATGAARPDGGGWTGEFEMTPTLAEPMGYLAATQAPDGMIHLISSRLHYGFNLAWLRQPLSTPVARDIVGDPRE